MSEINIEEFINVDLRVAKIKEAHEVPDADKLVELILDLGESLANDHFLYLEFGWKSL